MNYTHPDSPDYEDDPKEWLNAALIMTRAAGLVLEDSTGVVVSIEGDSYNPIGDSDKIIVFRKGDQVHVDNYSGNLEEGEIVRIMTEDEEDEEDDE